MSDTYYSARINGWLSRAASVLASKAKGACKGMVIDTSATRHYYRIHMMMVELQQDPILNNPVLKDFILDNIHDPWSDIKHDAQGYKALGAKQKGLYGEIYARILLEESNKVVAKGTNYGHDYIVDGHKTEVKFSVTQTDNITKDIIIDTFMMNHIGQEKDWDRLLFIGINPCLSDRRVFWFTKSDVEKCIELGYLKRQSSGEDGDNDDYMTGGKSLLKMIRSKYAHTLDQW